MSRFKLLINTVAAIGLILIIAASSNKNSTVEFTSSSINLEGFAVMELFTSQGCSSCPPADDLLAKYAALNNDQIIPLAFHVDYWNRLGWTDSFSSAKYSTRQRNYAMIIDNASVYTPQLIVNGEKEFVGSDATKIDAAVQNAVKVRPGLSVLIEGIESSQAKLSVHYNLNVTPKNARLQAALVQKKVFTKILKGENRGLKLTNYNVVRDFVSTRISSNASVITLNIPAGYSDNDFAVILYVQDDASGKITGAVKKIL